MSWIKRGVAKARRLGGLIREGQFTAAAQSAASNFWATTEAYGLRRDLVEPFDAPEASIDVTVRPLQPRDLSYLITTEQGDSPVQVARQQRLLDAEIPTCWVAVDDDGLPCYMQWLILPEHNDLVRDTFGSEFPRLADDEVLLEGAFTPSRARGKRVGPRAMSLITAQAPPEARWAWTFVATDNVPALKLVARSGYEPASLRRSRWRLLRQSTEFRPLTGDMPTFG